MNSPLVCAIKGGSSALVRALIGQGAMVSVDTSDGRTALFMAMQKGNADMAMALLEAPDGRMDGTVSFVWSDKGQNLVHAAVQGGSAACLALVLQLGADADHRDRAGTTPLYRAAEASNSECMMMLLRAGADPAKVISSALKEGGITVSASPALPSPFPAATGATTAAASAGSDGDEVPEATRLLLDRAMRLLQREASGKRQKDGDADGAPASSSSGASAAAAAGSGAASADSGMAMDFADLAAALASVVQSASSTRPRESHRRQPSPPPPPAASAQSPAPKGPLARLMAQPIAAPSPGWEPTASQGAAPAAAAASRAATGSMRQPQLGQAATGATSSSSSSSAAAATGTWKLPPPPG
jgi:hypothetical protein